MMRTICAAAVLAALPLVAEAQPNTACPPTPGVRAAAFPAGVPAGVMAAFNREFSPYALPGRPFEMGDAVMSSPRLPSRRVMFARQLGRRWVILFEQGGESLARRAAAYQASADGRSATALGTSDAGPSELCTVVERMLRGHPRSPSGLGGD